MKKGDAMIRSVYTISSIICFIIECLLFLQRY